MGAENPQWPGPFPPDDDVDPPDPITCPTFDPDGHLPTFEDGTTLRRWTADLCPHVYGGITIRDDDGTPINHANGEELGSAMPCTFPARAEHFQAGNDEEACALHLGRTLLDVSGDGMFVFCSNHEGHPQTHESAVFIAPVKDARREMPGGDAYFVTAISAPEWTEAIFFSHQRLCRGVPV